jgi:two-component system cell cycle sensor histidine kinase/response regulator CckA
VKGILRSLFTWHTDTILIAEPDQVLRQLEYRALSPKYRIVQTSSVEEAVRTAARHATEIDLLLTEVRLPHGSGWDLMELLKLDYPDLKVIYLSSSIDAEIRAHTRRYLVFMLENPFHPDRLRQAVRAVLETRPNDRIVPKYAVYSPPISRPPLARTAPRK